MFERRVEPFGVGMSFKVTTNPPTDPTQTAKVTDPMKPKAPFITETMKGDYSNENTPLGLTTGPL